jgi:hypothetical protein
VQHVDSRALRSAKVIDSAAAACAACLGCGERVAVGAQLQTSAPPPLRRRMPTLHVNARAAKHKEQRLLMSSWILQAMYAIYISLTEQIQK